VVLLDLAGHAPPRTLTGKTTPNETGASGPAPSADAGFLATGAYAGRIALLERGKGGDTFGLLDPADPENGPVRINLDSPGGPGALFGPWIRGNYLIYGREVVHTQQFRYQKTLSRSYTFHSSRTGFSDKEQATATDPSPRSRMTLFYGATTADNNPYYPGSPWNLGGELFAYIEKGELHARTYDGVIDVPLEPGVAALYDVSWDGLNPAGSGQ
jgi:hypothetical protein